MVVTVRLQPELNAGPNVEHSRDGGSTKRLLSTLEQNYNKQAGRLDIIEQKIQHNVNQVIFLREAFVKAGLVLPAPTNWWTRLWRKWLLGL